MQGYLKASRAMSAVGKGLLKPDSMLTGLSQWHYQKNLAGVSEQLLEGVLKDIFKRSAGDLAFPNPVSAPGGCNLQRLYHAVDADTWSGAPSKGE